MTLARGTQLHRVKPATTMAGALAARFRARLIQTGAAQAAFAWPSPKYQADPQLFGWEVLGVELWERQIEILEAVRDNMLVAIRGGRKVGKDFVLGVACLWFFCSFPRARVRFTAVSDRQVNEVFWREVRMLLAGHGRCVPCKKADPNGPRPCPHSHMIPEEPGILARTGLHSHDFREVVGFTAREAEGAAGVSGEYQLNIADEASGLDDFFFEAVMGNMGGCRVGRLALISNPTRNSGEFYRAFHDRGSQYHQIHISSRTTPNVVEGRIVVPGLATREWVETMVEKYRDGSDFIKIHVDGDFVESEVGTIFSIHDLDEAIKRWSTTPAEGSLYIGVDVAGESGTGDESAFAARRGNKVLGVHAKIGMSPEAHLIEVFGLIARHGGGTDTTVVIDRGGEAGQKVYLAFQAHLQENWRDAAFKLVGVRASDKAMRDPKSYDRVRDELIASLAEWMHDGGAIPDDSRLAVELNAFRWEEQRVDTKNKLVDKIKMRGQLGRSPDRADAVALSAWRERAVAATVNTNKAPPTQPVTQNPYGTTQTFDPYRSLDWTKRRGR